MQAAHPNGMSQTKSEHNFAHAFYYVQIAFRQNNIVNIDINLCFNNFILSNFWFIQKLICSDLRSKWSIYVIK